MAPYHQIYRVALVLLLAAFSGCGGNQAKVVTELQKGNDFLDREDYDAAIACYTEAIRLDPNYALVYNNRGWAYSWKGEDDKAIKDLTEAIRLKPDFADAYGNRGMVYERKGDLDKAKSLGLDP